MSGQAVAEAPPPTVVLPSGQRAYEYHGLTEAPLSKVPTMYLKTQHFPVSPMEVLNWEGMSKSGLKRAMFEVQWEKLLQERERRKRVAEEEGGAAAALVVPAGGGVVESGVPPPPKAMKRSRPGRGGLPLASPLLPSDPPAPPSTHPWIMVDCGYDPLMTPSEMCSLTKQLAHSYSGVKRVDMRKGCARLILAGLGPSRVEALKKITGVGAWRVYATALPLETLLPGAITKAGEVAGVGAGEETTMPAPIGDSIGIGSPPPFHDLASLPRDKVVYLTHEAEEVVWEFKAGVVYVVGGLVDRNRHKGVTASKAAKLGLRVARLPLEETFEADTQGDIKEGVGMKRKARVLTTNKCVDLLARMCGEVVEEVVVGVGGAGAAAAGGGGAAATGGGETEGAVNPRGEAALKARWAQEIKACLVDS